MITVCKTCQSEMSLSSDVKEAQCECEACETTVCIFDATNLNDLSDEAVACVFQLRMNGQKIWKC